jgi:hypothetical protein
VVPFRSPRITRTVALAHRRDVELAAAAREFARSVREMVRDAVDSGLLGSDTEVLAGT